MTFVSLFSQNGSLGTGEWELTRDTDHKNTNHLLRHPSPPYFILHLHFYQFYTAIYQIQRKKFGNASLLLTVSAAAPPTQ